MFTGIVEALGRVERLTKEHGARLVIEAPFGAELVAGESVAVNGCCLTQLPGAAPRFEADLSPETLARTALGSLSPGDPVNLERALRLGDRLGGHLVQGHVDGVVVLLADSPEGEGRRHRYSLDASDEAGLVSKGSVTIDGVSLTVAALGSGWFEVALVPHTLAHTTLGARSPGHRAHIELDLVGKYVLRAVALGGFPGMSGAESSPEA